jgi:hypothetical protein
MVILVDSLHAWHLLAFYTVNGHPPPADVSYEYNETS